MLELGSGGGNNASHYKQSVRATLVDRSPGMLALSQRLNPECEHRQGDMRSIRLGRTFDAVLVQDAVLYLTTEADLRSTMVTAFEHCRPGGVALFAPDYTRETFAPATTHGGHDGDGRALRYLAWIRDPDPADTTYVVDFAYLFHEDGRPTRSVARPARAWAVRSRRLAAPARARSASVPDVRPFEHSELPAGSVDGLRGAQTRRAGRERRRRRGLAVTGVAPPGPPDLPPPLRPGKPPPRGVPDRARTAIRLSASAGRRRSRGPSVSSL